MQPMRAAQKSDPDLLGDVPASTETVRDPIESQIVETSRNDSASGARRQDPLEQERVDPSKAIPASQDAPDFGSSLPLISVDSESSHPVHVNTSAFGPPAVVINDTSVPEIPTSTAGVPSSSPAPLSGERISEVRAVVDRNSSRTKVRFVSLAVTVVVAVAIVAWWSTR